MNRPIILNEAQWAKLYNQLSKDYHSSVILIRTKMRHVLGFTVRRHREWLHDKNGTHPIELIHLDFYDEPKRTLFVLKYTEFLSSKPLD